MMTNVLSKEIFTNGEDVDVNHIYELLNPHKVEKITDVPLSTPEEMKAVIDRHIQ